MYGVVRHPAGTSKSRGPCSKRPKDVYRFVLLCGSFPIRPHDRERPCDILPAQHMNCGVCYLDGFHGCVKPGWQRRM